MLNFLTRLAQVDSIQEVILLSTRGEVLFQAGAAAKPDGENRWQEIIAGLAGSPAAELSLENGWYYVHDLDLGHVIVGMRDGRSLEQVKTACSQVKSKLAAASVRKKVLLKMLDNGDAAYTPHLVRALGVATEPGDREIPGRLIDLLQQEVREGPGRRQDGDRLLCALCEALGQCASAEALAALRAFLADNQELSEAVKTAAGNAVRQLMRDLPQNAEAKVQESKGPAPPPGRGATPPPAATTQSIYYRQQIEELLGLGKKGEAIDRILAAIEAAARGRQFEQAEKLRDWLMQIDSLALREIIRAAEIIEQARLASISGEFRQTWHELELALSVEEFSTLYHAMTPRVLARDELVVRQGEFASSLLFVNSGRVQLYAVSQDREIPLKICAAGEILGADNFFESSVWTVNARSLGAELYVLTREKLQRQQDQYPALAGKLMEFCRRFPSPNALFSKTGRSRRRFDRKKAAGRATMVVLDEQGEETGIGAKGDILDVSRGGLSFNLRFSQKKHAEALLGRKIRITMRSDSSNASVTCNGKIMAVRCCDFIGSDYSLHVEFPRELDNAQLQQVLGSGKAPRNS